MGGFLDFINLILSRVSKKSLNNFFSHYQIYLNEDEINQLFLYIQKHHNQIKTSNFKSYLYDSSLNINENKKHQIYQVLKRFI